MARAGEAVLDGTLVERAQERLDPRRPKRWRLDDLGRRIASDLRQASSRRAVLVGSRADHERDRDRSHAPSQIGEKPQRRLVRPVGIVNGQQQGAALCQVRRKPVQPVQDSLGRRIKARRDVEDGALRKTRRTGEKMIAIGFVAHSLLEALAHEAHRILTLQRASAPVQDGHPGRRGAFSDARQQARLADPRRSFDQRGRARPRPRRVQHRVEARELVIALHERERLRPATCRCTHRRPSLPSPTELRLGPIPGSGPG